MLNLVDRAVRWVAVTGGLVLLAMVALTVVDVGLRYVFNAPIFGAQDVTQLMLLVVVATSLAYGGRSGAHVAVDLLSYVTGAGVRRWTDILVRLLGAAVLSLVTLRCYNNGVDAALYGETSNLLQLPFLPYYFTIAAGLALYVLVLLAEVWASLRRDA